MTILTNWRDHLDVHPAAEMFPLLSETDPAALKELAEDIRQHGQREPASYIKDSDGNRVLLDGRNRLDALEMLGRKIDIKDSSMFEQRSLSINAQAFIISKNIHRRHLTPEKKRDLIGLLRKSNPEKSDRQIATVTKADHKTVGAVRADLEGRGEIPHVEARTDTKGREQPARRLKHTNPDCPDCGGNGYFKGGDSGRCHCHGSRPKKSTSPDCSRSGVSQVSTAPEKLASGLPTGSDSSELVPCSPAERRAAKKYEQEQDEIMRVEAERLVKKLLKTDIESARSLYRILDSTNVQALIFTLREPLSENLMVKMTASISPNTSGGCGHEHPQASPQSQGKHDVQLRMWPAPLRCDHFLFSQ
jgi:ParB-like nuclease domain